MRQAMAVAAGLLCGAAGGWAEDSQPATAQTIIEKWVEARRLITQEQQDWRLGRELLQDRIEVVKREVASLREKTARATSDMGDADKKLAELQQQREELKTGTAGLAGQIPQIERRLQALLVSLPAPVQERVRPLSQSIPRDAADTKLSMSERFQNLVGILNEVNKVSREIAVASEVRDLPDGTRAEVTVMYLGVAQAVYGNLSGGLAGIGVPGTNGWTWTPSNQLAQAVADAVAVYRNERPAGYTLLPLAIH
jgi:hypothetical protein